ncbi:MAG: hypothetical protein HGA76_08895, partial [Candidatus Firestonebacteria bacterium]|nr:hypothetical protein [Candidatus Firestonebacteria bacterium]
MKPAGRPTWVEVDLAAVRHNARQVRRLIGPRVKLLAVVKANAYGHGAVPCSRALLAAGAEVLGVATVEELYPRTDQAAHLAGVVTH